MRGFSGHFIASAVVLTAFALGCRDVAAPEANALHVTPDTLTIPWGESRTLDLASASPGVRWTSSDPSVAVVDDAGRVTARRGGSAVIRATDGDRVGEARISVELRLAWISAGYVNTCGASTTGRLLCWGAPEGLGSNRYQLSTIPVEAPVADSIIAIQLTTPAPQRIVGSSELNPGSAACALGMHATYCWGGSTWGETGRIEGVVRTPAVLAGGPDFSSLSAGRDHFCALSAAGTGYCWGDDLFGQIGTRVGLTICPHMASGSNSGLDFCATHPLAVDTPLRFTFVSAGAAHTCAIEAAGQVYCWGNLLGFAQGSTTPFGATPTPIASSLRFTALAAATSHTCAIAEGGAVYCWGSNASSQLGLVPADTISHLATRVDNLPPLIAIDAGDASTCGLAADGRAFCWGANDRGQLGDGNIALASGPVASAPGLRFVQISVGWRHACGRTLSGAAYCWGLGTSGQLGSGTTTGSDVPVRVGTPL